MEGLLDAAQETVASLLKSCLATTQLAEECLKLGRSCTRLALLLAELRLVMHTNEALRGSKTVFLAVDATVGALRQAEQLVAQCASTGPGSIWPEEDAVEFQAVAAELRSAASSLAALGGRLPPDVQRDAAHVYQQFAALGFTEGELSETEELELERVQHVNSVASPRHPDAVAAAAAAVAAAAPPAAPLDQYAAPEAALAGGAVADSARAAARARAPPPPPTAEEVEERRAVAGAAAVAHEAAAEVLSAEGDDEAEEPGGAGEEEAQPAGEEEAALAEEMREEVAAAAGGGPVVLTHAGETALAPEAPAKGAVPSRGSTPLPPDPFAMAPGSGDLGPATLVELRSFQRGQGDLALADEAQRQLEATADNNLALAGGQPEAGAGQEVQTLAALRQLREYEAAMEAGEEAESAADAAERELDEAAAAAAGGAMSPLHKSRSQVAAAILDKNLAELASEYPPNAAGSPAASSAAADSTAADASSEADGAPAAADDDASAGQEAGAASETGETSEIGAQQEDVPAEGHAAEATAVGA